MTCSLPPKDVVKTHVLVHKHSLCCIPLHLFTGKAGGFLALDWTDELARVSYALHQDLAATCEADIGYRPIPKPSCLCYSVQQNWI